MHQRRGSGNLGRSGRLTVLLAIGCMAAILMGTGTAHAQQAPTGDDVTLDNIRFTGHGDCLEWDTNGTSRFALKKAWDNKWLQEIPFGLAHYNAAPFGADWKQFDGWKIGDSTNSCTGSSRLNLPNGRYFLGIRTYGADGTPGPKAWHQFYVSRATTLSNIRPAVGNFDDCRVWDTNARSRFAIRRASDGQWLQSVYAGYGDPGPADFGPQWKLHSGDHMYRGDQFQDGTCGGLGRLDLEPGTYFIGVRTYALSGQPGPRAWESFTIS